MCIQTFFRRKRSLKRNPEDYKGTLEKAEVILTGGKLIDATILKAPSSTKNKEHARDPEMSSTKKRGNRHSGAKVHDSQVYDDLVRQEDDHSLGDASYIGEEQDGEVISSNITFLLRNIWKS